MLARQDTDREASPERVLLRGWCKKKVKSTFGRGLLLKQVHGRVSICAEAKRYVIFINLKTKMVEANGFPKLFG